MAGVKKRGLGKGLNELLKVTLDADVAVATKPSVVKKKKTTTTSFKKKSLATEQVDNTVKQRSNITEKSSTLKPENTVQFLPATAIEIGRYQPRKEMDPDLLEELAQSIKSQGLIQPILVRQGSKENRYELVAGERRWRATQLAGLDKIPAIVRPMTNEAALAVGIIENIQRENLNPLDEARSIKRLIDEFAITHTEAAEALGRSRAQITNLLRLMNLNSEVQKLLERGELEMGHARALLSVTGKTQSELAHKVVMSGMSVRDTEKMIQQLKQTQTKSTASKTTTINDPNISRLEIDLAEKLGAKVTVKAKATGKGMLIINYNSLEELDGIIGHIQ